MKDWNKSIARVTFSVLLVPLPSVWALRKPVRRVSGHIQFIGNSAFRTGHIAFYPQVRSTVSYNICLQQTRRESKPLTAFSKQSSLEKRWRRALWGVSQKLPIPPGKLEPLTGLLDCQALIWVCPMCHFSEPVSIYVSFLCVFVLNKSVFSLENPQLFALGKSIYVWFPLFLSFSQHLFSAPEGMSTCSSFTRRPSWLCIL